MTDPFIDIVYYDSTVRVFYYKPNEEFRFLINTIDRPGIFKNNSIKISSNILNDMAEGHDIDLKFNYPNTWDINKIKQVNKLLNTYTGYTHTETFRRFLSTLRRLSV